MLISTIVFNYPVQNESDEWIDPIIAADQQI